jgi:hypothetical protein
VFHRIELFLDAQANCRAIDPEKSQRLIAFSRGGRSRELFPDRAQVRELGGAARRAWADRLRQADIANLRV